MKLMPHTRTVELDAVPSRGTSVTTQHPPVYKIVIVLHLYRQNGQNALNTSVDTSRDVIQMSHDTYMNYVMTP